MKKFNAIALLMTFIILSNGYVATINARQPQPQQKAKQQQISPLAAKINELLDQCEEDTLRKSYTFYTPKHGLQQSWFNNIMNTIGKATGYEASSSYMEKRVSELANRLLDKLSLKMAQIRRDRPKLNKTITRMAANTSDR